MDPAFLRRFTLAIRRLGVPDRGGERRHRSPRPRRQAGALAPGPGGGTLALPLRPERNGEVGVRALPRPPHGPARPGAEGLRHPGHVPGAVGAEHRGGLRASREQRLGPALRRSGQLRARPPRGPALLGGEQRSRASCPATSPRRRGRRWATSCGRGRTRDGGWGSDSWVLAQPFPGRRVLGGMELRLFPAALLLLCACFAEARPRPPPPRLLSAPEAVAFATQFARSRGLVVDFTRSARLDRHARWHVVLTGARGRDHAALTLDGYSGRVLGANLRSPRGEYAPQAPPTPPAGEIEPPQDALPSGAPPPPQEAPPPPPPPPAPPGG